MRLALISDIHEDIIQLQLALEKIRKLNCDEIVCLGDISGFSVPHYNYLDSRNARECLRLVRENCSFVIAGNHDLHVARRIPQQTSFNYPENWYKLDFHQRAELAMEQVWLYEHEELSALYNHQDVQYLSDLPEYTVRNYNERHILFAHFIYPNLTGSEQVFYFDAKDYVQHQEFMFDCEATLAF
ncbi:MAG: metallophosphoesterase [Salinivirgaceae bacterium]|jgi:predicted phosphodiesterase|nr:metallophosphoesterase [Salinivirgaceae bacterium]